MKRYLIFAAIGPFVGGFLLLLATTYQSGYWSDTHGGEVAKLFIVFGKSLQYNYLFGVVPAMMFAAIDDILMHVRWIAAVPRMLIVGAIAFIAAALMYASHGADTGVAQFILYGIVGLVPGLLSSWLAHKYAEEPRQPAPAAQ
jgi:hypothetical protein